MIEDYRMYLLIKAEMVNVRVGMNMCSGMPRGLCDNANVFLVPIIIKTLEDDNYDLSILNTAYNDLNIVISGDSYMKNAISYEEFVASKRDSKLSELGI